MDYRARREAAHERAFQREIRKRKQTPREGERAWQHGPGGRDPIPEDERLTADETGHAISALANAFEQAGVTIGTSIGAIPSPDEPGDEPELSPLERALEHEAFFIGWTCGSLALLLAATVAMIFFSTGLAWFVTLIFCLVSILFAARDVNL